MSRRQADREPDGDEPLRGLLHVLHEAASAREALIKQLASGTSCLVAIDNIFQHLSTTHDMVLSNMSGILEEYEAIERASKMPKRSAEYVALAKAIHASCIPVLVCSHHCVLTLFVVVCNS